MFDELTTTHSTLQNMARGFETRALSGQQAVRAVEMLGAIHRLTESLLADAVNRVAETSAHEGTGDRDAATLYGRAVGVEASKARRVIETAKRLEHLPATAAAVRDGRLSGRQAQLVAEAAARNPGAEAALLAAASEGMVRLKDACVLTRARSEDETARAARLHAARRFRMWTASDGIVEGRFKLAPEVGGRLKAAIDARTQRIFRSRRTAGPHESLESLEAYSAEAFADLVLAAPGTAKGVTAHVHILIEHGALVRGEAIEGEQCEIPGVGPVSVAWVRELVGEAFVTAVIKKGRDITTVAHFGRHIPAHLVTAMIAGGRECDVVGCSARGYLERDHSEVDYAAGGPTAWWNLGWMCGGDHRKKSKGWILGPRDPRTGKRTLRPPGDIRLPRDNCHTPPVPSPP